MQAILSGQETSSIQSRIKEFERNTGCELLLVVAKESDDYPAAPWRFGVIVGFILTILFSLYFEFHHSYLWPLLMIVATLLGVFIGHQSWAKRLALADDEVARETFEKAVESFHTLGTSKVSHKVTAMIMVSVLERRITVLVDEKLKTQITQAELDELVSIMQIHFKQGHMQSGFIASIESLEKKVLKDFGGKVSDINPAELNDQIIFI